MATIARTMLDKNARPILLDKNDKRISKNVGGGIQTTISICHENSVVIPESTIVALIS